MFKRVLTALTLGLALTAQAQTFPTKPVRIITPFPVGSGPEGVARLVADKLSKSWGQPVTVENRPGGNGFIAIDAFKRGATDGTDLIQLDNVHLTAYPHLFKKLPYNAAADFDVLLPLFKTYFFFTTAADSKYKNVADVVADAKANPGKLNYGSWSVGNPVHLGSALFETVTGTEMQHVIYKETTQLYTGVSTGELAFAMGTSATAGPLYRAGKIKFLAIAAPKRLPAYKDVPTVAEAGLTGFGATSWGALLAPAGTPKAVIDRLHLEAVAILNSPDVKERLAKLGLDVVASSPAAFTQMLQTDVPKWGKAVKDSGATIQ